MTHSVQPDTSKQEIALGLLNGTLVGAKSITATQILARHGMTLLEAKRAIEEAMETGRALRAIPKVEHRSQLTADLHEAGFDIEYIS